VVKGERFWKKTVALEPAKPFQETIKLPEDIPPTRVLLNVSDFKSRKMLVSFSPLPDEIETIPSPATPAQAPEEIASNEELFLNGLHLEQYRHATYTPELYYMEALRRDPGDSRCNNAMGLV